MWLFLSFFFWKNLPFLYLLGLNVLNLIQRLNLIQGLRYDDGLLLRVLRGGCQGQMCVLVTVLGSVLKKVVIHICMSLKGIFF